MISEANTIVGLDNGHMIVAIIYDLNKSLYITIQVVFLLLSLCSHVSCGLILAV